MRTETALSLSVYIFSQGYFYRITAHFFLLVDNSTLFLLIGLMKRIDVQCNYSLVIKLYSHIGYRYTHLLNLQSNMNIDNTIVQCIPYNMQQMYQLYQHVPIPYTLQPYTLYPGKQAMARYTIKLYILQVAGTLLHALNIVYLIGIQYF